MTNQTHVVSTDALGTLGTIIDETAGRDAIHLAVEPVLAGERLLPGDHIGRAEDGRWLRCRRADAIGIVDPFLEAPVQTGERFWLVIYPRKITALRHVWEHPAFPSAVSALPVLPSSLKDEAELWLRNYAKDIDETFTTLLEAADDWVSSGRYFYGSRTGDYYGKFEGKSTHPDFWRYYQAYRGTIVSADMQESFFTCSC